jgi:anaerobic ribonucleoside-triphosphate reductase activating protein
MNRELIFMVEPDAGRITVEVSRVPKLALDDLQRDLGKGVNVNCGRPSDHGRNGFKNTLDSSGECQQTNDGNSHIWLYRLYHNSTVDGPGRRSVVQVSGCSIRCPGCYVPQTHERENGFLISIASIVDQIVAQREEHDGVTILGGEPFDQPGPVAELAARLKRHRLHLIVYTGYSLEALIERREPNVDYILTHTDLLIDGPFLSQLGGKAGEYRGSRNQRFIANPMTHQGTQRSL